MGMYESLEIYYNANMETPKDSPFYTEEQYYILADYGSSCEYTSEDIKFMESLGYYVEDFELD